MKQLVNHINGRNLGICFKDDAKLGQIVNWLSQNLDQLEHELEFNEMHSCVVSLDKEGRRDVFEIRGDEDLHFLTLDNLNIIELPDAETYEFQSSHGTLVVDEDGVPVLEECEWEDDNDPNNWLKNIAKVDLLELANYYKVCGHGQVDFDGDVLDFGFWDKEGNYNVPDRNWREECFHNVNRSKAEQLRDIERAEIWVETYRTT